MLQRKVCKIVYPVNFFVPVIILDIIKNSNSYTVISSFRKYRNNNRTSMSDQTYYKIYMMGVVQLTYINSKVPFFLILMPF